jgi:hypothetical protein
LSTVSMCVAGGYSGSESANRDGNGIGDGSSDSSAARIAGSDAVDAESASFTVLADTCCKLLELSSSSI